MKYTHKIVLWSAGSILLVGLWVTASFRVFQQTERAIDEHKRTLLILDKANALLSDLRDAETGQRGYLLTGDETFLEPYLAANKSIPSHLEALRQSVMPSDVQALADALAPLVEAKSKEMAQVIEIRRNKGAPAAIAVVAGARGKQLMDSIRAVMHDFTQVQEDALAQRDAKLQLEMRRMFAVVVAASLVALLCALTFLYSLKRGT